MKKLLSFVLVVLTAAILLTACSVDDVIDSIKGQIVPDSSQGENTGNDQNQEENQNQDENQDENQGGNQNQDENQNGNQNDPSNDEGITSYTVSIKTAGGMAMKNLPVYVFEKVDGVAGDLVDNGYGTTDENGSITFTLPTASYVVKMNTRLPEGYACEKIYDLCENLEIVVSSSVIMDENISGVNYELGSVMHDFTVTTVQDERFTLSEVLQQKDAVLINFWYTSCAWCQVEFPILQESYNKYSDDIAVIALNPPFIGDTFTDIRMFMNWFGYTFDAAQDTLDLYKAFDVVGYPTSVLIDRYGVITMIEVGAITNDRFFDYLFEYVSGEDYQQILIEEIRDFVPEETPDVEMPSSEEIGRAFESSPLGIEYKPYHSDASDEEKKMSWPFIIGEYDGFECIYPSNAGKNESYAQLHFEVSLKKGEVLALDYFTSCEQGADILYISVDGKNVNSISGESSCWETSYIYVPESDGTYEICMVYSKDSCDNAGEDTVYLKNLRVVSVEDIDSPTYIFRHAAKNPNAYGEYKDFITPVLGSDGYYHVNRADGPILLVDLLNYTDFSSDNTVYYMAYELYENGRMSQEQFDLICEYGNYSSNGSIYGLCSVTPDLKELIEFVVGYYGAGYSNEWLVLCCYYDAYGTSGARFEDPIKGLASFSAYDVIESEKGDANFPNSFTYDKVIMPVGYFAKFTPTTSGTYLICSYSDFECDGWIYVQDNSGKLSVWHTYENVDRMNRYDYDNCYMIAYLDAGKDYYINIAFYDVYQFGTINYRVERLGGEGYYRFAQASQGIFHAEELPDGTLGDTIFAGGIDVVCGADGIWREKRTDGRVGSIIYADFTYTTSVFSYSIERMIDMGAFDFSVDEDGNPTGGMDYTEIMRGYLSRIIKAGYNEALGEYISAGDARIGCVIVTDDLADILQMLMDKYTFPDVENSWLKLCYYNNYFCSETPFEKY